MKKPTVTAAVVTPKVDRTITLTMNEDVAKTLLIVAANCAGDGSTSRRVHTDSIAAAIRAQGVEYGERPFTFTKGYIEFKDESVDA